MSLTELVNNGNPVESNGYKSFGATVKIDFSSAGFLVRLLIALHVVMGRPFLYDGVDVYESRD